MGEMSVYFDGVTVPNGVINIHTRTSLGETQIFVPKDWKIVNNVRVTAGDVTFKGLPDESGEGSIECVVDGNVFCGNLEINRI